MSPGDVTSWWTLIEKGGLLFVFAFLTVAQAWAYYKRWVVPGWVVKERDQRITDLQAEVVTWRTLALNSSGLAQRFAVAALESPPSPREGA